MLRKILFVVILVGPSCWAADWEPRYEKIYQTQKATYDRALNLLTSQLPKQTDAETIKLYEDRIIAVKGVLSALDLMKSAIASDSPLQTERSWLLVNARMQTYVYHSHRQTLVWWERHYLRHQKQNNQNTEKFKTLLKRMSALKDNLEALSIATSGLADEMEKVNAK